MSHDDIPDEPEGDDDMVAAEYVVGTLTDDERQAAARRIDTDPAFARAVDAWAVRLAPMSSAYAEAEPPGAAKPAIDRRLFGTAERSSQTAGLFQSLVFWRGLAGFAVVAAVALAFVPLLTPPAPLVPEARLAASLADPASGVHYLVVYDTASGEIGLSHVAGDAGTGSFELWLIAGGGVPASLGTIAPGDNVRMPVDRTMRDRIAPGVMFAISLEPHGGSPTGQPTGPVVAAGELRTI